MKLRLLCLFSLALTGIPASAAITVDGTRDTVNETEYSQLALQSITSAWGGGNTLANIHSAQTGKSLNLFVAGRPDGNAIIIFIDSKSGGVSNITNNLIKSGGLESDINNLATSSISGMTFESGFQPDYALRVYGGGSAAYSSLYDLQKGFRFDLGQVDNSTGSHGPVSALRVSWADVTGAYADAVAGIEVNLNMPLLGVPEGAQNVKVMALLVNGGSTYGSNQTLGSLGVDALIAGNVNSFNFETETGTQTLTVNVNRPALVAGEDEDGDGITNGADPFPLEQTRDIEFSVNMTVQQAEGLFAPPSNVQVQFFSGSQAALSTLTLTDPNNDLIYTGTLANAAGFQGESFGTYKFITNDPNNPNGGYEYGFDRTFIMGSAGTTQTLTTEYFSNDSIMPVYNDWKNINAGGQSAGEDFDGDGIDNGAEYFMGTAGNAFTANPSMVAGAITWPRAAGTTINSFKVEISDNLSTWQDAAASAYSANLTITGSQVSFTLPPGVGKIFTRLSVTP